MNKDNHKEFILDSKDLEDVFGGDILKDAEYDISSGFDILFVQPVYEINKNIKLISYSRINTITNKENYIIHFYQKDYTFDGVYGIWNAILYQTNYKKGFNIQKLNGFYGIICPDYSINNDMPNALKIWNVYRSRVVGYYLNRIGFLAIPNVRWADSSSYRYCFSGLKKNSLVAVGTVGCLRSKVDKALFLNGLVELINRIHPKCIILYGNLTLEISDLFAKYNQDYLFFPSQISEVTRYKHGNESK